MGFWPKITAKLNILNCEVFFCTVRLYEICCYDFRTLELPEEYEVSEKNLLMEHYGEGDYLVRPGDKDDNMIVVLEGIIGVFIMVNLSRLS